MGKEAHQYAHDKIMSVMYELATLSGPDLENKARERYNLERKPGETDAQLRCRSLAKADEELALILAKEGRN